MRIGMWVWPSFTVVDAWMCFVAYPGAPFGRFLLYRIAVEVALIWVHQASRRPAVSVHSLRWSQNAAFSAAAVAIALMAVSLGGVRSPYMHGISIVALVRAAVIPEPWRRAAPGFAAIALAFPVVMALVALLSPAARAEWLVSDALVVFASNYIFVLSSAAIGMVTSHIVWQAQQRVYRARRVGRYRLLAPIGKGGMGEVWLAWDLSLQRNVALKLLRAMGDAGPDMVARFEREALATSRLHSPHVIQIFDYGASEDGLYYIAMEYLNGRDLGSLVRDAGPLPARKTVDYVIQACMALEVAHNAGVIHRDIKPENLFLVQQSGERDLIKLLDFGIVRFREPGPSHLTWTGMLIGTPLYIAPELWTGAPADERSDIYALGVTSYFLLTGRLPFAETDRTGRGRLAPIFESPTPGEQELEALVVKCLAPDPAQRTPTAQALRNALTACRPGLADQPG
jgi:serine/threonine-protein kinase